MGAVDTPQREKKGKKKGGGVHRPKRRVGVRIDMTPMVDVAFLLLIFFMVTTVFRTPRALEINLPPKDIKQEVRESNTMTIRILADGRRLQGDDRLPSRDRGQPHERGRRHPALRLARLRRRRVRQPGARRIGRKRVHLRIP